MWNFTDLLALDSLEHLRFFQKNPGYCNVFVDWGKLSRLKTLEFINFDMDSIPKLCNPDHLVRLYFQISKPSDLNRFIPDCYLTSENIYLSIYVEPEQNENRSEDERLEEERKYYKELRRLRRKMKPMLAGNIAFEVSPYTIVIQKNK